MRQRHPATGEAMPPLTAWGLSANAYLIYRCLLTLGVRSAEDIERALGLPAHRVTAGLDELFAADAARPRRGRWQAVWAPEPPAAVESALRRRHRPRPSAATGRRDPFAILDRLSAGSVPLGDGLRHLPSRALARARMGELVGLVRHEHMAMSPERVFDAESARAALPLDRKLLLRGVRMRVLGAHSAAVDPLVDYGRAPEERRPEYRQSLDVRMKLVVLDRRVALFPVTPADLERGYLEVTDEAVVAQLAALFDRDWAAAARAEESRMPQIVLTDRERTLVGLLLQGHTDSSAAQQLRLSRRTVCTTLSGLMDKLGVSNRFQLGVALGALRIVPAPGHPQPSTPPRQASTDQGEQR